jgi:hypothetical protein
MMYKNVLKATKPLRRRVVVVVAAVAAVTMVVVVTVVAAEVGWWWPRVHVHAKRGLVGSAPSVDSRPSRNVNIAP